MGRYDSIYSDEQREALARAVLEDGLTAREAVEKAAAGELDTPAFEIPLSTAQGIVTQAKRQGTLTGFRDPTPRTLPPASDRHPARTTHRAAVHPASSSTTAKRIEGALNG
jgi:hypothetical protein